MMMERCVVAVSFWIWLYPVLATGSASHRFDTSKSATRAVRNGDDPGVGLFPRIFNLAKHADVAANATCGLDRPEVYCRRPVDRERKKQNGCSLTICDGKKNGARKATDGSKDSWISPTLEKGMEFEYVTFRLDMKQVYQVVYVTLKAGIAPRPAAWILERSVDGVSYSPWQYFAENDAECRRRYGLPATHGKPHYKTDDEVICTIFYSKLYPLENGEIHVSLLNGRPGSNTSSDVLRNFTLARYVRFRFQKIHKTDKDIALRKKLFYSIRTISIGGQCLCHGHASKCTTNSVSGMPSCECEHHTCGRSCSECCPLFNQQPWRPGTLESAGACEPCQCFGHATACRYNEEIARERLSLNMRGQYRGGGECLNCSDHTTGVNCERCEKGWYRPLGVQPDDPSPCYPCECHPKGSVGSCVRDDSDPDEVAGSCRCKEGYTGLKCDRCSPGWTNFPDCEPCSCDPRGTQNGENCTLPCTCKANVEGKHCDKCKKGFFALSLDNPDGCTKCYCSGVSDECEEARGEANLTATTPSLDGWLVTDLSATKEIVPMEDPDTRALYVANYELPGVESYYWVAPPSLSGDQIHLYGVAAVEFDAGWEAMRGDTSGQPTVGPNVVLVGRNGLRLGHGDQIFDSRKGNASLRAPLVEDSWYVVPSEVKDIRTRLRRTEYRGARVSREQFLSVMADVAHILLRATFHTDQAEGSLLSVKLERHDAEESYYLEKCSCPTGYDGPSCEKCSFSYYRDNDTSADVFNCLPCSCNGHSQCSPDTGICEKCQHNTQGDQCQVCLDGFYGDATTGTPDDCQPCACPLLHPDNNFTPYCELQMTDGAAGNQSDYVCIDCPSGYRGKHCELCDDYYYGNPLELGSSCQPCDCKGGPCHNVTGHCLQCEGNTEGVRCENCKPFHYGNPLEADCKPCNCDARGSLSEACDAVTGQCPCRERYAGRKCDRCDAGYGNVTSDCGKCDCGLGASGECDPVSGECACQAGAAGPRCDECQPHHYGLSRDGCQGCGCHVLGSEQAACDIVTGQCHCKPNVTGRACDECQARHWGLSSEAGCRPCECDPTGSLSESCNPETGQCPCRAGVGGRRCETCLPGHYGFSRRGCLRCQECNLLGHVCDPETGRCVCPPYTYGVHCQLCAPNTWGYSPGRGCTPCNCHTGGSERSQCDPRTGRCRCRTGFVGDKCEMCDRGYYRFPVCKSCECDPAGTEEGSCDAVTGRCQCDENGTCPCKANADGVKCDRCKPGTFGLERENPIGCIACFCFGRSASCTQAGLHWSRIRSGRPRSVFIEYDPSPPFKNTLPIDTQEICYINLAVPGGGEVTINGADRGLNVTNNLRIIPGDTGDVKIGVSFLFDTPVYWRLPEQFLGDKVLSYGGYLRFVVETVGGHTQLPPFVLSTYPLVQLQGNNKIILEHFPVIPSQTGRYDVRFHESLWEDKLHPDRKVTRETLMVALQNIQHILIRASDSVDFTKITLKEVSMDSAAPSPGISLAGGIELCECPPEYNSTSCQDPSIGFYRWYDKSVSTATILIQLVGEARPCQCNNRSRVCDIETGHCLDCANNTGGAHCERCGVGYYGDPSNCRSCPCPTPERNFAQSCRVTPKDVICTCKPGYTGKYCDRCAYGWFGHPEREGGSCQPCDCNPHGSVSDECDEKTGQCNCRPGIEGKDCSICPKKEVLTPKGCSTCEDGCTGILLKDFDRLSKYMERELFNIVSTGEPPWKVLKGVQNRVSVLEADLRRLQESGKALQELEKATRPMELFASARTLKDQAQVLATLAKEMRANAVSIKNDAVDVLNKIEKLKKDIEDVVSSLNSYASTDGPVISDSVALIEGKLHLNRMKNRSFKDAEREAERVLDYCTGVLNKTIHMNGHFPEIQFMKEQSHLLLGKLKELETYVLNALELAQKRLHQAEDYRKRLKHLADKIERVNSVAEEAKDVKEAADDAIRLAKQHLASAEEGLQNLTRMRTRIRNGTEVLKKRTGILSSLNPQYRDMYLLPTMKHAEELMKIAEGYRDMFNSTRKNTTRAVEAGKAYQDIVDALESVRTAAKEAKTAADSSHKKVTTSKHDAPLREKTKASRLDSEVLRAEGTALLAEGVNLRHRLNREMEAVEQLRNTLRLTGEADNRVSAELRKVKDLGVSEDLKDAVDRIDDLGAKLERAKEEVRRLGGDVMTKLKPLLTNFTENGEKQGIEKAREHIKESLANHRQTMERLNKLNNIYKLGEGKPLHVGNDTLKNVLEDLKNKITQARHAAESIRLPLTSNSTRGCVRSFGVAALEATTTNRLAITLTVDPSQRNGVIFYLPSSTTSDYMCVEIVDGIVRFVWNNGGGPGVVWKAVKNGGNGSKWYKIVIERISYTARLWVLGEGMTTESTPPSMNSSSPNFGRMDVGPGDRIWVGGLPPGSETPPEILSLQQGLIGCLHGIELDDRPIGLWNYYTDSTDSCSACERSVIAPVDGSKYSFNGEGYSVLKPLPKTIYNKYQFSAALKFKTFDDNALLFLAISSDKARFVSLSLRDGRVVFQIGYGGESQLEMSSSRKYNDGNWTVVEASRNFDKKRNVEKGLLKVGDELKEAAPPTPPARDQIPELATADYLVGGVPPGYSFGSLNLRFPKSFLGCMYDLFVDNEIYNPLKGRRNGMRQSCSDQLLKMAGFRGEGYIKQEASRLKKDSAFGLALRTLQPNAFVLLANGRPQRKDGAEGEDEISNDIESGVPERKESYYSISLVDGRVEVRVDAGKGPVTLVSRTVCNDGRFHSVSVVKSGRKLELRVDDELQSTSQLPGRAVVVKAKDLYLGGVPEGMDASHYVSHFTPFVGTIKDVLFNNVVQKFDNPVSFVGVDIGRLGPERMESTSSSQTSASRYPANNHSECHRSRKYVLDPRAVKFGDSPYSHVQVNIRRRGVFQRNFTVELDFRTFHRNGLVFIIPGTSKTGKQKHFISANLKNGLIITTVKAKRKLEHSSMLEYDDGNWHRIQISREDRKLILFVDSKDPQRLKLPKKVNLGNSIYIGGVPEVGVLPESVIAKMGGFTGCMRSLKISNQSEELIGEKSIHQGVGQCFPHVEKGSYFSGDGFVSDAREMEMLSLLKIELEFRTSEMNGILLIITHVSGAPILSLEIHNGTILMSGSTSRDGERFRLVHEFPSKYTVCDNKWHRIDVIYENDELIMRVDHSDVKRMMERSSALESAIPAVLYVGGLPEHMENGKPVLETRDNFKGCVRSLAVGGERKDFTEMDMRQNVLIGSCPVVGHH